MGSAIPTSSAGSERSALMVSTPAMTPKPCHHCQLPFYRSGRPEQRFCSRECHRADRYRSRPTSRRCEHCLDTFELGRRKTKRFCSVRCVALWRERLARLRRMRLPPPPPRVRRKPGRIEWRISGGQNSRGMAPTPRRQSYVPRQGSGWARLMWRSGFRN